MSDRTDDIARLNARFARTLVWGLGRGGVRHAVVSPGSRSTPLVLALEASEVEVHTVLDERVAGFVALGLARAGGAPVVLACTSGTAGGHYLPALMEAHAAALPVVALTADRPPELQGCGAPQTVPQARLFGAFTGFAAEVGPPDPARLAHLPVVVAQALDATREGPVHLDVAFREPLWAAGVEASGELGLQPRVVRPEVGVELGALSPTLARLRGARRGVVVCGAWEGPQPRAEVGRACLAVARRLGWPVFAEVTSPVRDAPGAMEWVVSVYDSALRAEDVAAEAPDAVLRVGAAPLSKPLRRWLSGASLQVQLDRLGRYRDPDLGVAEVWAGDEVAVLRACARALRGPKDVGEWAERWRALQRRGREVVEEHTGRSVWGGSIARAVWSSLPGGGLLHVGASLPMRDLDGFTEPGEAGRVVTVNRGVNGIDGTLATAWGEALATGGRVHVLCGDLTALHDVGGLAAAAGLGVEATVVVADNGGGGIFGRLPIAAHPTAFERHFLTPQTADLEAVARGCGATVVRASDLEALREALAGAQGLTVIRVPFDRAADEAAHAAVWDAVGRACAPVGVGS